MLDEAIAEVEEGKKVKLICGPCTPSQEEIDVHMATHIPFRAWCRHCVWGRAISAGHKRGEEARREGVAIVEMDYMGKQKDKEKEANKEWGAEGSNPIMVMKDRESKYLMGGCINQKGVGSILGEESGTELGISRTQENDLEK
jgi:hypothetical protein